MTAATAVQPIGDEALAEVLRLAGRATRGPWYRSGSPWFSTGALVLAGSPDRHAGHIIVDTDPMDCREDVPDGVLADPDEDAAYIAAANPGTVLAMGARIAALDAECRHGMALIGELTARVESAEAERDRLRAALEESGKALDTVLSLISYVNIHGVGEQPDPGADGGPQPLRINPAEFWRNFQTMGRIAAEALKTVEAIAGPTMQPPLRSALAGADR